MDAQHSSKQKRRLRYWQLVLSVPVLFIVYIALVNADLNFHEIIKGEYYRSGQPDKEELAEHVQRYGIKSIINLRGENENEQWYAEELAASKQAGVKHYDFRMSSKRELTAGEARALVRLMQNAPKPLWVHCRGGSDRSGLASALYVGAIAKKGRTVAGWQLSPYYGHLPLIINQSAAMDRSFTKLAPLMD